MYVYVYICISVCPCLHVYICLCVYVCLYVYLYKVRFMFTCRIRISEKLHKHFKPNQREINIKLVIFYVLYVTWIQTSIKGCIYFQDWVDFRVSQRLGFWFYVKYLLVLLILELSSTYFSFIFLKSNWQNSHQFLGESQ